MSRLTPTLLILTLAAEVAVSFSALGDAAAQGFLTINGQKLFPLGCYELPQEQLDLRAMADAGFNLVHCANNTDLDRAKAAGMMGWISLLLESGDSGPLRKTVENVMDHPALAVWEGPDEVVWNFTAFSGLHGSGIYKQPGEWWRQTPFAVERSEAEAKRILSNLQVACQRVRTIDRRKHPIWINEAAESDMKFIRQYIDHIDITGCDIYPIYEKNRNSAAVSDFTDRYQRIGQGKPVWMVLQGFSWHEMQPPKDEHLAYPTFWETRLMAYEAITHGAKGILYWGTWMPPKESPFRQSVFALVSELRALQPFLVSKDQPNIRVSVTESKGRGLEGNRGVRLLARRAGSEWLIVLVNEDNSFHMGVELMGLDKLEGKNLDLLYDSEMAPIHHGGFVTRLRPYEVKVFATSRKWESSRVDGRDFH